METQDEETVYEEEEYEQPEVNEGLIDSSMLPEIKTEDVFDPSLLW